MKKTFESEFGEIVRARFPLIYIQTFEEERILEILRNMCSSGGKTGLNRSLYVWSQIQGLLCVNTGKTDAALRSPFLLFDNIENAVGSGIYLLLDFHIYLREEGQSADGYQLIRRIKELGIKLRSTNVAKTIVFVSPVITIPEPLEKYIMLMELPLPDQQEIRLVLERLILRNRGSGNVSVFLSDTDKETISKAALGLTQIEAEGTFSRAMVNDGTLNVSDIDYVLEQKQQILKKSGVLEYVGSDFNMNDVGGLENLKNWLIKRNQTWMDSAKVYNLPPPKGVLLVGVPGCGKSLCAKAISSMWKLPLLRFDMGSVFGKYVGESESNMRKALNTAEALAPCILWVDEIEKGLAGASGGEGDSGTTKRVFGSFLTWMQEKKSLTFVFATANQINNIPPELLRKGRFDEIFFVDIPDYEERKQIFKVHLNRRLKNEAIKGNFQISDEILNELSKKSEGFVGAEIEQTIISALYDAFFRQGKFDVNDVLNAINNTVPLTVMQREYIQQIRDWAAQRAIKA